MGIALSSTSGGQQRDLVVDEFLLQAVSRSYSKLHFSLPSFMPHPSLRYVRTPVDRSRKKAQTFRQSTASRNNQLAESEKSRGKIFLRFVQMVLPHSSSLDFAHPHERA
mmetsp:Transcript_58456/g.103357  ORF Transcript_58456/g.103357 Transcript_58456/m.103357 type:complete len:109 (-) Transcript_58456:116-442(-)